MRRIQNLMEQWLFIGPDNRQEQVNLPHTWNAKDGQDGGNDYYRGTCHYEKTFEKPEFDPKTEEVYLEFLGVNASSDVTVNGKELAHHDGGYSTFRVNITEALQEQNKLEVTVDNSVNGKIYPQKADFTFYGGIYRDVRFLIVSKEHFDLDYLGSNGIKITPEVKENEANVHIETFTNTEEAQVNVQIKDQDGKVVAEGNGCDANLNIQNPIRWHGRKNPYLYTAVATLTVNGEVKDEITNRFGIRTFHVDPKKGFFLNGEHYPLHGVSRHQDFKALGNAISTKNHDEDMDMICELGANTIRLAHYQHDQYFYDLCDEKGIVAWAEIPYITVHMDGGRENTISQMKELIVQNYNHASIICWAISNEISLQGVTEDLLENHRILNDMIHRMDQSRVSAMANLFMLETDSPLVSLPDIRGYNLYYGWYVGEMEDNDAFFDQFHKEHPDTVIGLTEYGADSVIKLQSPKPQKGDYTESYMAVYHEHMLEMISQRPYLWGTYVWNMFEFAAAGRDEAGDPGKNHKGLITFDRKEKKDAYYIYKAWWSDEPFVHLCGRRYADRIETVTEIKVYSNQKRIALYVDGKLFGEQEGEHIFKFEVPICGEHTIKAVCTDHEALSDEMTIQKVSEPNPAYFMDATKVCNWFEEPQEESEKEEGGYLSLNSTMAEIQAVPAGAALLAQMMKQMQGSVAGGMGKNVKIPETMMALIARQPLKKLLAQGGIDADGEQAKMLAAALGKIPKK